MNGTGALEDRREEARELATQGRSMRQIAEELGIGLKTVVRYLNPERARREQAKTERNAKRKRDAARLAAEVEERKERAALMKSGGPAATASRLLRESMSPLTAAMEQSVNPYRRERLRVALTLARRAEDAIVAAGQ